MFWAINMTQQDEILILLRQAGSQGVNSYGMARDLALQLPRVMNDLKKAGYLWTTRKHKNRSVDYILVGENESKPSQAIVEPQKVVQPWEKHLVRVEKNGRIYYEDPEDLRKQDALL